MQWEGTLEMQVCDGTWQSVNSDGQAASATVVSKSQAVSAAAAVAPTLALDCSAIRDTTTTAADDLDMQSSSSSVAAPSMKTADAGFRLPRQVKQHGQPTQPRQQKFTIKKKSSVEIAVGSNDKYLRYHACDASFLCIKTLHDVLKLVTCKYLVASLTVNSFASRPPSTS